jgi:NAD(P)-dependent dehydrogenase (short-subunit alcohol dehydrogenase family)
MTKTVLITGSTDGIGLETAVQVARTGARVVVHGRSAARVLAAEAAVRAAVDGAQVDGVVGDLSSLAGVRALAAKVLALFPGLDVVVNNAGVYMNAHERTVDGIEVTFAVNHVAPFLLVELLLPRLRERPAARIVNVSSIAHTRGRVDVDTIADGLPFSPYGAYAASKLANILHANALARRLEGTNVVANSLHPGVVGTKLLREGFGMNGNDTVEEGARTSTLLAMSDDLTGVTGQYFVRARVAHPSAAAHDVALQDALWSLSTRLCARG